jgi:hypothetical protein
MLLERRLPAGINSEVLMVQRYEKKKKSPKKLRQEGDGETGDKAIPKICRKEKQLIGNRK